MRLASDILDLFSRVADGVQSEDDERRLVALLKTDAAAREAFQRVMELHSTLHWMYVTAAIPPRPRSQSAGPSQTDSASGFRTRWIAAALASVLVLGGVVGGIATRLVAGRQAAPAAAAAPAPAAEDRASGAIGVIGMIEKARLVVPAAGGKAVRDGDPLHAGRLAIAAGVIELRLGNGVRIVLEGPGELELFGEMAAFLYAGKAVVRMPDGMKGFRLDTATTDVLDLGTSGPDSVDYPDFGRAVAEAVASGRADLGVVVCGTGIGISIAANRNPGVRAAQCHSGLEARLAREHNDANVLALGSRIIGVEAARDALHAFLNTEFAGGRHAGRVAKLSTH